MAADILTWLQENMADVVTVGMILDVPVACPNCGEPTVDVPVDQLEPLHSGLSVDCPKCGGDIVFGVFSPDEWAALHRASEK